MPCVDPDCFATETEIQKSGLTVTSGAPYPFRQLTGVPADRRLKAGHLRTDYSHEVTGMASYPPPGPPPGGLGARIEEAIELIEMELRHTIGYVNDAVIPQVRRESILAMRSISDTLRNLADRFERKSGVPGAKGPQP